MCALCILCDVPLPRLIIQDNSVVLVSKCELLVLFECTYYASFEF